MVSIQDAFANQAQATEEYQVAVTNLATSKSTLTDQVALYDNRLPTKESDNDALHKAERNLQDHFKNIKDDIITLKKESHSGGSDAIFKYKVRSDPKWKFEVQPHHNTW